VLRPAVQLPQHVFKLFPKFLITAVSRSVIGLSNRWEKCAEGGFSDSYGTCLYRQGKIDFYKLWDFWVSHGDGKDFDVGLMDCKLLWASRCNTKVPEEPNSHCELSPIFLTWSNVKWAPSGVHGSCEGMTNSCIPKKKTSYSTDSLSINRLQMAVLLSVEPCSLMEVYWCFRDACCLHHQGDTPVPNIHADKLLQRNKPGMAHIRQAYLHIDTYVLKILISSVTKRHVLITHVPGAISIAPLPPF
jgi:hypothetical protein